MDPIDAWVDRDELRRMAKSLLASPQAPVPPPADASYGDEFVGYTSEGVEGRADGPPLPEETLPVPGPRDESPNPDVVKSNARRALAAARDIAQRGGMLEKEGSEAAAPHPDEAGKPAPAKLTQVSPVTAPARSASPVRTPFVARLQAYGTWLRDGICARAFFVIDRDGGILIDEVQSPKLRQVARTLAQASWTANRQAGAAAIGNLHIKIAPDSILEVVPVTSRYGPLILGVIVQQPLSTRNVEAVARGLQQVVDGQPGA